VTEDSPLVDRLAALPTLAKVPPAELEWLAAHGRVLRFRAGEVIARKGEKVENLFIMLSGRIAIQVDRGVGPRLVTEWQAGAVTGMLPYSRMKGPPGNNYLEEDSEVFAVHEKLFPEMISRCPAFTAFTVHTMLDRARAFSASDLQDEKMVSLGKLAAGLAHEINNPASATLRAAKQLLASLGEADAASRALGAAGLSPGMLEAIEGVRSACLAEPGGTVLSAVQQADREEEIAEWLASHGADETHAEPLAETAVTTGALDALAEAASGDTLDAALRWIAAGCVTHSLATDIEQAAGRISEIVSAVKRFTYMDNLAGPEPMNVEAGLRDTVRVLASKAKSKGASITLDVEASLPNVHATGSELNQVWLNLIDNALDAVADGGRIEVGAFTALDRVVVRVADDGPGIPQEIMPQIFDPFFTTKPPGQGTGLGLEIARQLVRRSHGDIAVQSRPGLTEFRVSLPVARQAAAEGPGASVRGSEP
jgi:signal transduction histidine kinase